MLMKNTTVRQFTIYNFYFADNGGFRFKLRRIEHITTTFDSVSHRLNRNLYVEFSFQNVDT
jgi:hypothetical protein